MTNPYSPNADWPSQLGWCHVVGKFMNLDGTPTAGSITFSLTPDSIEVATQNTFVVPVDVTANLDSHGAFSVYLPASDDIDASPRYFTYSVSENFDGGRKTYFIEAPGGQTVNLVDVSPVSPYTGVPIFRGPPGPTSVDPEALLFTWAVSGAYVMTSVTRDTNNAITSANVIWPDSTVGTYTTDVINSTYPTLIDAFHVTYGSPAQYTFTQGTVTRNGAGYVTAQPDMTVSPPLTVDTLGLTPTQLASKAQALIYSLIFGA